MGCTHHKISPLTSQMGSDRMPYTEINLLLGFAPFLCSLRQETFFGKPVCALVTLFWPLSTLWVLFKITENPWEKFPSISPSGMFVLRSKFLLPINFKDIWEWNFIPPSRNGWRYGMDSGVLIFSPKFYSVAFDFCSL